MKLRTKTTIFFGIFFLTVTLAVVVYIEYIVGNTLKKQAVQNFSIIAEQSESTYFVFLEGMKTRVVDWTSDPTIQRISKEIINTSLGSSERAHLAKEFEEYVSNKKMPYDSTILHTDLLDKDGIVIASTESSHVGKNEKEEEILNKENKFSETIVSKFGEVFFGSIVFDKESNIPGISATVRLFIPDKDGVSQPVDVVLLVHFANTDQITSALGAGNNIQIIKTIKRASSQAFLESYNTSDIYLVNNKYTMVTPSRYIKDIKVKQNVDTLPTRECLDNGKEISEEYDNYQGIRVLGASMCFKDSGLVLIVEIQKDEIYAPLATLTRITIAGGIIVLVFGILIAMFFVRIILKRIDDVVNVARRVAEGDLNARTKVESKDEIGYLASMFNTMISSVSEKSALIEKDLILQEEQNKKLEASKKATVHIIEDMWDMKSKVQIESNKLQTIISSIWDGLILIDTDYNIVLVNPKASEFFAMSQEELVGSDLRSLMKLWKGDSELLAGEWPVEKMFLTKSSVITTIEDKLLLMTTKRDVPLPVELYVTPLEGAVAGGVIIISDITADRELDEAKSGFISVASHQLRTPLTSIRWYSEMLLSGDVGPLNEAQKDFMTEVHGGAERLYQTVDLLLGISRVESGKIKAEKHPIDLSAFTEEIAKELASQVDEKKCKLSILPPTGDPVIVLLDPLTLRQVIINMFSNAIRYTNLKDGVIEISWRKNENEVVYSVRDNGIGIPSSARSHVFSKFFRAENARTQVPDGSGLGLALVKEIVESWGGKVWFETEEGKGSTFFFTVPLG